MNSFSRLSFPPTVLFLLTLSCFANNIEIGQPAVLALADDGNANLILAQRAALTQSATIQSLSFYVTKTGGSLILGVYDATGTGGGPNHLLASTASFTPARG